MENEINTNVPPDDGTINRDHELCNGTKSARIQSTSLGDLFITGTDVQIRKLLRSVQISQKNHRSIIFRVPATCNPNNPSELKIEGLDTSLLGTKRGYRLYILKKDGIKSPSPDHNGVIRFCSIILVIEDKERKDRFIPLIKPCDYVEREYVIASTMHEPYESLECSARRVCKEKLGVNIDHGKLDLVAKCRSHVNFYEETWESDVNVFGSTLVTSDVKSLKLLISEHNRKKDIEKVKILTIKDLHTKSMKLAPHHIMVIEKYLGISYNGFEQITFVH